MSYSCNYFVLVVSNFFLSCEFYLLIGKEINVLFLFIKLFFGLRKLKNIGFDFVVNVVEVSYYIVFMYVSIFMLLVKRL